MNSTIPKRYAGTLRNLNVPFQSKNRNGDRNGIDNYGFTTVCCFNLSFLCFQNHYKPRVLSPGIVLCISNFCFSNAKFSSCNHFCHGFCSRVTQTLCIQLSSLLLQHTFLELSPLSSDLRKSTFLGEMDWQKF